MQPQTLDNDAVNLAKAIRQTESGGNFQAQGKSGEYGAYQFTEPTWNTYAQKYGMNVPLKNATKEQQNEIAYKQIKEWKDQGLNPGQIASMWNSGKPDAYLDPNYKGVNKQGIQFDVPAYAKSVATAYQKIKQGGQASIDPQNPSSTANTAPVVSQEKPQEGFLPSLIKGLVKPVATMIARPIQAGAELLGASAEDVNKVTKNIAGDYVAAVPQNATDVAKDIGRAAQTVALGVNPMGIGGATKLGALAGGGAGLENEGTLGGATKGALIGGGIGFAGGAVAKALEKLPLWLSPRHTLGLSDEEMNQALATKTIGTKSGLLSQSEKSTAKIGDTIKGMIQDADKAGVAGKGADSLNNVLLDFPEYNSEKGLQKLITKIKNLIPNTGEFTSRGEVVAAIDKIANGTASIEEKNMVRSAIDQATSGGYAKLAKALSPSAGHDLAMTFANNLRDEVQSLVPETQQYFQELTKELSFRNALRTAVKKGAGSLIRYNDILPFLAGESLGGIKEGIIASVLNRTLTSPATRFAAAKGSQLINKIAQPVVSRAGLISLGVKK